MTRALVIVSSLVPLGARASDGASDAPSKVEGAAPGMGGTAV